MMVAKDGFILFIVFIMFINSEGKLICLPDVTNGSCQWTLFGWETYHRCGYKQKINENLCIMKKLDGSKSTFLTKMSLSLNYEYCLEFKYLITGSVIACMNFYGKSWMSTEKQSNLFSTFCIPNEQSELLWYSFSVSLPKNLTMINVVTESIGIASNHSLTIKDLSIQQCHQTSTLINILPINSTVIPSLLITKKSFWIKYQWIFIIVFLILLLISFIVILYTYHQESIIPRRIPISPLTLSQHFYEEPISIILQSPIDISVYDHLRDNYV